MHKSKLGFSKKFGYYFSVFLLACLMSIVNSVVNGNVAVSDPALKEALNNTLYIDMESGCRITVKMWPDVAPKHVAAIKKLVKNKFYDNLVFHRVIKGFMAQAGGQKNNPNYSSQNTIPAEFSNKKHVRGIVSMARAQDPNSASSQFFIVTKDSPFLDNQYSIWGIVVDGMSCVDNINQGPEYNNGMVESPSVIKSIRLAMDAEVEIAKSAK